MTPTTRENTTSGSKSYEKVQCALSSLPSARFTDDNKKCPFIAGRDPQWKATHNKSLNQTTATLTQSATVVDNVW